MDVLVRPAERTVSVPVTDGRAPWQTGVTATPIPPLPAARRIVPTAIPVVGGRPIDGRRLVRAPWAEPLAAFAGVVVETRLVPDAWLRPRSAARRAVEAPLFPVEATAGALGRAPVSVPAGAARMPARPTVDGLVAIPIALARATADAGVMPDGPRSQMPARVPTPPPSASTTAPVRPAGRRGFLGRAVMFTVGLLVSLVAVEAAARMGRR